MSWTVFEATLGEVAGRIEGMWKEREELVSALKGVLGQVELGALVRNTGQDGHPGWAMAQVPLISALRAAQDALGKAEGGGEK